MLKTVFAQPFFINGMACTARPLLLNGERSIFASSPHATPTTPSYFVLLKILGIQLPPAKTYTS